MNICRWSRVSALLLYRSWTVRGVNSKKLWLISLSQSTTCLPCVEILPPWQNKIRFWSIQIPKQDNFTFYPISWLTKRIVWGLISQWKKCLICAFLKSRIALSWGPCSEGWNHSVLRVLKLVLRFGFDTSCTTHCLCIKFTQHQGPTAHKLPLCNKGNLWEMYFERNVCGYSDIIKQSNWDDFQRWLNDWMNWLECLVDYCIHARN